MIEHAEFTEHTGAAAAARLLGAHPDLDAIVAGSDNMAAGAIRAVRASGRRVPDDVSVVGFDDLPIAQHTEPPLTTVHQPIEALGREMAKMLVALVAGRTPSPLILPTRLVERASVRGGTAHGSPG